jgi:biotin carboxyl carrier protein
MKLKAKLDNQDHELTVDFVDERALVQIDGRTYEIDVRMPEQHSYLLLQNNGVYDCRVSASPRSREILDVSLRSRTYPITIIDPRRLRSAQDSDRHHYGAAEIVAPMPGKVVRVLVEVGAEVEKGAGIAIVEAMKMQNEMKSPRAGVVVSLSVTPGDTVNAGDVLAVVKEQGSG